MPNSDLVGLIRRHVGLCWKLSLWSFKVMNDSLGASVSTLLSYLFSIKDFDWTLCYLIL